RLAAARLEDAQLGHAAQLLLGRGPRLAGGGEEEVQACLASARDRVALGRHAGGAVPADERHHRPGHVPGHALVPALELVDQALREPWGCPDRLGPGGQLRHSADYTAPTFELRPGVEAAAA